MNEFYSYSNFAAMVARRDEELAQLCDELVTSLAQGSGNIHARMKTPKLNTTPVAVRERALQKRVLDNLDKLKKLAPQVAEIVFTLHLDETELALVMDQRCDAAIEYWRRLADGKVYAGGRALLDLMWDRGIDANRLASLTTSEIDAVTKYIQGVLEKKWSRK